MLAQFFMDDEQFELVNANEKELLMSFRRLSVQKQQALLEILSE